MRHVLLITRFIANEIFRLIDRYIPFTNNCISKERGYLYFNLIYQHFTKNSSSVLDEIWSWSHGSRYDSQNIAIIIINRQKVLSIIDISVHYRWYGYLYQTSIVKTKNQIFHTSWEKIFLGFFFGGGDAFTYMYVNYITLTFLKKTFFYKIFEMCTSSSCHLRKLHNGKNFIGWRAVQRKGSNLLVI